MISVEIGAIFTVGGTVKNSGSIMIDAGGRVYISRDTILQGGGKIILSDNGSSTNIVTAGTTLTNVDNTISGSGIIDATLVNQKNGVIDANGSSQLELNTSFTNAGVLESTSTGGLVLIGSIANAASGVIGAFGAGSGRNQPASAEHERNATTSLEAVAVFLSNAT